MSEERRIERLKKYEPYFTSLLALAIVWQTGSNFMPPYLMPSLIMIGDELLAAFSTYSNHILATLYRIAVGMFLGFLIGVGLGILMGLFRSVERRLIPIIDFLMSIPAVSWVLIIVIWLAGSEPRIITILMIINFPIFAHNTLDGIKSIPKEPMDMLMSFRPTKRQIFTKLILPATIPNILTAWKVVIGLTVRVVGIAELVGATTGIGYMMFVEQGNINMAGVLAWTLVLVVIGLLLQLIVGTTENKVLRWRMR